MNITYTGKQEQLHPDQQASIDTKIAKLSKLLEGKGNVDKPAHVILAHHKNSFRAEITLNFLDHALVGEHTDAEQFTAINFALDKLEKQILKVRDKRRDIKKGTRESRDKGAAATPVVEASPTNPASLAAVNGKPKVYRVAPADSKPMTIDEALLVIDEDYLVYRDANSNGLSVLLRRVDGNFDLVEC